MQVYLVVKGTDGEGYHVKHAALSKELAIQVALSLVESLNKDGDSFVLDGSEWREEDGCGYIAIEAISVVEV